MELQKSELLSVAENALVVANQIRDKAVASAISEYRAKWYNRLFARNMSDKEIKAKIYKNRESKDFYNFMVAFLVVEEIRILAQKYIDMANEFKDKNSFFVQADEFFKLKSMV